MMPRIQGRGPSRRPSAARPSLDWLEGRELLSTAAAPAARPMLTVALAPRSAAGDPANGVTDRPIAMIQGRTMPDRVVGMDMNGDLKFDRFTRSDNSGRFQLMIRTSGGVEPMTFAVAGMGRRGMVAMTLVSTAQRGGGRPFDGSPTPAGQPFTRLIPDSVAYAPGLPPRPDARAISQSMAEDPNHPAYAPNIELGLVFLGQFTDHDMTLNQEDGQGPSSDPANPVNLRTPALDLDPVYMGGPHGSPQIYTPDGLFFRLGAGGNDLLRDAQGVAMIGDPRNDDNGPIASIHLAFQKFHNALMTRALNGMDPARLNAAQKDALFGMVHNQVVAYFQGMVTHQFAEAITGQPIPTNEPPIPNTTAEFFGAVFRLGHTLVPNRIIIDHQGDTASPTDPNLRQNGLIPYDLMFGPHAQPAAAFDSKISETMRTLLIPLSPTSSGPGDLIGGNVPNIGQGQVIDGVMHLDLGETNILRGRELKLPSGEEYLAHMEGRPYNPATDGNTDLFQYILDESNGLGHLGKVGTDVVDRTIGGLIAGDPYRYNNPAVFTRAQIRAFSNATFEGLLHTIGAPGF